eukprot:CAMPEP_0177677796 /NCGR_PEP_ID=MMETSP0447-20121125/28618_1 /TAXON_ID=0 /ORGANISM="Stygamoeba regulata, Strain BSH-02190019" /LENGTH=93 /DNA_ID=CAMNT_0019186659 /DNA_START=8 /DNA_END=286 /DNA_ORIENTATION=-
MFLRPRLLSKDLKIALELKEPHLSVTWHQPQNRLDQNCMDSAAYTSFCTAISRMLCQPPHTLSVIEGVVRTLHLPEFMVADIAKLMRKQLEDE